MTPILRHVRNVCLLPSLCVCWGTENFFQGLEWPKHLLSSRHLPTKVCPWTLVDRRVPLPAAGFPQLWKWVLRHPLKSGCAISVLKQCLPFLLFLLWSKWPTALGCPTSKGASFQKLHFPLLSLLSNLSAHFFPPELLGMYYIKICYWHCYLFGARDILFFSNSYKPGLGFHPQPDLEIIMHYWVGIHCLVLF
jgi:hypothetical protein